MAHSHVTGRTLVQQSLASYDPHHFLSPPQLYKEHYLIKQQLQAVRAYHRSSQLQQLLVRPIPPARPVAIPGMIGGEYDRQPAVAALHHPPHASLFRPHPLQDKWRKHDHFFSKFWGACQRTKE